MPQQVPPLAMIKMLVQVMRMVLLLVRALTLATMHLSMIANAHSMGLRILSGMLLLCALVGAGIGGFGLYLLYQQWQSMKQDDKPRATSFRLNHEDYRRLGLAKPAGEVKPLSVDAACPVAMATPVPSGEVLREVVPTARFA